MNLFCVQSIDNFRKIQILFSLDTSTDVDQHLVIINNSPIRHYHVLLVPNRQEERAQVERNFMFSIDILFDSHRFWTSMVFYSD